MLIVRNTGCITNRASTLLLLGLAFTLLTRPAMAEKFFHDDPILAEPETQDASNVQTRSIDLFYDLSLNQFTRPGLPPGSRARNVNTIDEVPDSSWFTNRILARPLSIEDAERGPLTSAGPAPGQLTVIRAKSEGAAPGFTVRDSAGVTWFLAFDPKSNPEGSSGAAAIAMRIFWALGYYQAEYHIGELAREQLLVAKDAKFLPASGRIRPMTLKDIEPVLQRAAMNRNGTYRMLASQLLPGKVLGGFKYYGTRSDDPNDVIPHEQRRELRALRVFGAWTNLVDVKALNTMDTLITENGRSTVRHYLLDVGSTFGMGANGPHEWTDGYEHLFDGDKTFKRLITMGFYLQPWQTVNYEENRSIGRFEGDQFDPLQWRTRVPAAALLHARDDDNFWAARRVMAFSDDMIRALVKTGKYSDPASEKLLADVLIKRRDQIGRVYFSRTNPVVNLSLDSTGTLRFENVAASAGIPNGALTYAVSWAVFNNDTGEATPLGQTKGETGQIGAPSGLPQSAGVYVTADVSVVDPPHASWAKPVRATFRRGSTGWKLVGVDRMHQSSETPSIKSANVH
jgi:hypothetical protein